MNLMLLTFKTIFDDFTINSILDCIFVVLTLVAVNFVIFYFVRRKAITIILTSSSLVYLVSYILCFDALELFSLLLIFLTSIVALFINMAELRKFFANQQSNQNNKIAKKKEEAYKIFDHTELYKTINETILYLSEHKIGALITFERKDKLSDIIKNGTELNCPISFELLITIFYPGTRLHDGAVVIKDNHIIAASVYYTPTTKPLIGKYGSRHRAAIGISEICDAVTVVVSEETGRISIAYNGEIESYLPEDFLIAFENVMSLSSVTQENNTK